MHSWNIFLFGFGFGYSERLYGSGPVVLVTKLPYELVWPSISPSVTQFSLHTQVLNRSFFLVSFFLPRTEQKKLSWPFENFKTFLDSWMEPLGARGIWFHGHLREFWNRFGGPSCHSHSIPSPESMPRLTQATKLRSPNLPAPCRRLYPEKDNHDNWIDYKAYVSCFYAIPSKATKKAFCCWERTSPSPWASKVRTSRCPGRPSLI